VFKDEKQGDGKVFGEITGIKIETRTQTKNSLNNRLGSPDLWEISR